LRRISDGGIFHGKKFPWGGKFPGGEFFIKSLHWGNLSEFLYEIHLMSCFLFVDSILCVEMFRVIVRGIFSSELICLENIFMGRRDVSLEVEPDFLALFEKQSETEKKQVFSTESKEQH